MSQTTAIQLAHKDTLPIASMNDIATLGNFAAASGMFGVKTQAEGIMLVGICQQERWSYADFMANFDIIKGKLSKKPVAMLADFKKQGGSYTIDQRDENGTIITMKKGKEKQTYKCLWEDAQKEPFPYNGREDDVIKALAAGQTPPLKPKYVTPRSRMQMLWARCVGDAIRSFAPECCKGIYTPEEVDDFATEPTPTAAPTPTPVQSAPTNSVEIVPAGNIAGQRWDAQPLETLEAALNVNHPSFTDEMKDYIRSLINARKPAEAVEAEVVNG